MTHQPKPEGTLSLLVIPTRSDANVHGDISAGWVITQMDRAAEKTAEKLAKGRTASVALESVVFTAPIRVHAEVSVYTRVLSVGTSSIQIGVEVWTLNPQQEQQRKVVDATFVYVAIDDAGHIRQVPETNLSMTN